MGMMEFHRHRISQLHDAQMDMIVGLNKLTNCECPDAEVLCCLCKGIKDLQKTICMIEELDDKEEEEMEEEMMARMQQCDPKMSRAHSNGHMMNGGVDPLKPKVSPV